MKIIKARDGRSLLNLGCGSRHHPEWNNVDLQPTAPGILAHDLRQPLPFPANSFDAVYHSHVLEHFSHVEGAAFLKECHRVCRPGGIIRIVVPNLGGIARLYLDYLDRAERGEPRAEMRYDWLMLELCDQMVRSRPGGEMAAFLQNAPAELDEFLEGRMGRREFLFYRGGNPRNSNRMGNFRKLAGSPRLIWQKIFYKLRALLTRLFMAMLWGRTGSLIAGEVLFRNQGEVHRWMYDRYSLPRVLRQVGFSDVTICSPQTSGIAGWPSFNLDCDPDSKVYKPDSLICEAKKPGVRG